MVKVLGSALLAGMIAGAFLWVFDTTISPVIKQTTGVQI